LLVCVELLVILLFNSKMNKLLFSRNQITLPEVDNLWEWLQGLGGLEWVDSFSQMSILSLLFDSRPSRDETRAYPYTTLWHRRTLISNVQDFWANYFRNSWSQKYCKIFPISFDIFRLDLQNHWRSSHRPAFPVHFEWNLWQPGNVNFNHNFSVSYDYKKVKITWRKSQIIIPKMFWIFWNNLGTSILVPKQ